MFSSKDLFFTPAAGGYTVSKSLRFRSSATAYLSRTPGSAGNRRTFTFSAWVKRGALSTRQALFSAGAVSTTPSGAIYFTTTTDTLSIIGGGGAQYQLVTTQVFRDVSAWYHVVITFDTTQATASNRIKLYVNGSQVTAFSTSTYPSLNFDTDYGNSVLTAIGSRTDDGTPPVSTFDGYLAEVNYINGSALDPTSFGAYDTNGVWQPAAYTGSYSGTNSFYLKFTTVGATSGSNTGYGQDFSGNGNYWTTNNFGTTSTPASSGISYDSMLDSPTNATGDIGNYCVVSPINSYSTITISNANLTATLTEAAYRKAVTTMAFPSSGKYYVETKLTGINYASYGVVTPTAPLNDRVGATATGYGVVTGGSQWDKWDNGTSTGNFWNISTTSPTLQIAIDTTNGKLWIGYNDTWLDGSGGLTGNPAAGTNATFTIDTSRVYLPAMGGYKSDAIVFDFNAGQRPFTYTPPSGYSALNTQNLPTPTIKNGAQYMAAVTYGGAGGTQAVTTSSTNSGNNPLGTTFQPDFVWIKNRTLGWNNNLFDVIRGTGKSLFSDLTDAETTNSIYGYLSAFSASGFSATAGSTSANLTNASGSNYVAWQWNAGGAPTVDNTAGAGNVPTAGSVLINGANSTSALAGSIAATRISANTSAGFSVVTYTGNGTNGATVGHGLGAIPSMMFVKKRDGTAYDWVVYHSSVGATGYLFLNLTNATSTGNLAWNNTTPTSSVFTIGTTTGVNNNTSAYVAYCFAPVAGYSAFGSYTGNGSADGPFVYLGFRPRWLLIKRTNVADDWVIVDTSRNQFNLVNAALFPNSSSAETANGFYDDDILSNGFKIRATNAVVNASGGTYIYAAFAENPFKISRAR